jgi:hypothetical protein
MLQLSECMEVAREVLGYDANELHPDTNTELNQMATAIYKAQSNYEVFKILMSVRAKEFYDPHALGFGDSTDIRVIEILHNDTTDSHAPISCKLHVVSLDDAPSYTALSYVWGTELNTAPILLDGRLYFVQKNLFDFLVQYRKNGGRAYMWIDALCINQFCVRERNHQVALMGNIYSKADLVIAWLGSSLQEAYAVVTLKHHSKMLDGRIADALCLISENRYWSRVWIVQEFVLGKNLEMWSGYAQISGQTFCDLFTTKVAHWKYKGADTEISRKVNQCYWSNARTVATYRTENKRMDLFLTDFMRSECADPRDRIYGFLGVLTETQKSVFQMLADYSKPISILFLELWIMGLETILDKPTRGDEQGWWWEMHRHAENLWSRFKYNAGRVVMDDISERRKGYEEITRPWTEQVRARHVQALLIFAKGELETVEKPATT